MPRRDQEGNTNIKPIITTKTYTTKNEWKYSILEKEELLPKKLVVEPPKKDWTWSGKVSIRGMFAEEHTFIYTKQTIIEISWYTHT